VVSTRFDLDSIGQAHDSGWHQTGIPGAFPELAIEIETPASHGTGTSARAAMSVSRRDFDRIGQPRDHGGRESLHHRAIPHRTA
jgi:hypothetical protein